MSKDTFTLNEKLLEGAISAWLSEASLRILSHIKKVTPRDINWLPKHTLDRKDGKPPKWSRPWTRPVQIFGHWYEWVTGHLAKSLTHIVKWNKAYVGTSDVGPAAQYATHLEYGTSRIQARKYIRGPINDPKVQADALEWFRVAFSNYLDQYDRS